MIKNQDKLEELNKVLLAREKIGFKKASKIFEQMWQEGVSLKKLPPKDPLEGIERVIRLAKIINSCSKKF